MGAGERCENPGRGGSTCARCRNTDTSASAPETTLPSLEKRAAKNQCSRRCEMRTSLPRTRRAGAARVGAGANGGFAGEARGVRDARRNTRASSRAYATHVALHFSVQAVIQDQVVRELYADRLHRMARPVVMVAHILLVKVRDAIRRHSARRVDGDDWGNSSNARAPRTPRAGRELRGGRIRDLCSTGDAAATVTVIGFNLNLGSCVRAASADSEPDECESRSRGAHHWVSSVHGLAVGVRRRRRSQRWPAEAALLPRCLARSHPPPVTTAAA